MIAFYANLNTLKMTYKTTMEALYHLASETPINLLGSHWFKSSAAQ